MKTGKVYLVGAGPGDPDLITQKGLRCITRADAIVYDHLADERLLVAAPNKAERIYVGKTASEHTMEQAEINQLLVKLALEGKNVVRLKGGDPFVFGRGGEEAEELTKNKILFEIVPGISSSVSVPAYAGIPVTNRGIASSFAVITGHEDPTKKTSSINWDKLATSVDTLIFLMGMQNLSQITAQLIRYGRPPSTPVAVIKDGTLNTQRTVIGNLSNIALEVEKHTLTAPAVIVVGEVVKMRKQLQWFENSPLFGKRILVTRSRHQASALTNILSERGALPVELPVIKVESIENSEELNGAIENIKEYQWVIFTSVNGVEAFFKRMQDLRLDARAFGGVKIGVIGAVTAEALRLYGINADYCPAVFTSSALLGGLQKMNISGEKFLLVRADIADEHLSQGLKESGALVKEITVYQTVKPGGVNSLVKEAVINHNIDIITFASSSTVTNLVSAFGGDKIPLNGITIACIGPKTAETALKYGLKPDVVASEQTIPGMVTALEEYFEKNGVKRWSFPN